MADMQGANSSSDFVRKLYKMLEDPAYESVVRWGNDGDSFVVLENEKFTKSILPKHFKHSNFASFVRQLNKYDFHKVRHQNEDGTHAQYGAGAWEFKHPDFKMNNKDALDNIKRKAPVPRKPNAPPEEALPTQQMDMVNTQLVATQQQLQTLQERYTELHTHHSMLLQEVIGLQKTVVNHEHVIQNVMSFLHSVDSQRRRESRAGNPFAQPMANGNQEPTHMSPIEEDGPASPLQNADKLLNDLNAETVLNSKTLEHMNEVTTRVNGIISTPPPSESAFRSGIRDTSRGPPPSASSTGSVRLADLDTLVYPVGHNHGIDPMYSEHVNNIPYPMPSKNMEPTDPRYGAQPPVERGKKNNLDPGWIRQPSILLVEDDPTCRRIGGKFLYAFNCSIDSALDGLEAVNKMNAGSKYDLVLMDIIMPNLDGVSACHLIRQFDTTPIVAMTSNIRSDDISMYFQHGMNDVLPKPFTKEGLLAMLEKHLSHLKRPPPSAVASTTSSIIGVAGAHPHSDANPLIPAPGAAGHMSLQHATRGGSVKDEEEPHSAGPHSAGPHSAGPHSTGHRTPGGFDAYATQPGYTGVAGRPQHRRNISEISGGPEEGQTPKRPMYTLAPMRGQH